MKILAFNGSPRKKWNTATLLNKALKGAAAQGAKTDIIHLYDLNFKGCKSCFACKKPGGKSYGKCVIKDDLSPILERIEKADAIILGSPIYFGTVTGEMRSFMERLIFPYYTYTLQAESLFPKKIKTGFIYTMNIPEEFMDLYREHFASNESFMKQVFGNMDSLYCFDTYQFADYSKVVMEVFDAEMKAKRRRDIFPEECERAFDMGARLAG